VLPLPAAPPPAIHFLAHQPVPAPPTVFCSAGPLPTSPISPAQAIDKRLGYEKRFDKTKEDFRAKEKRKRAMGQQSSGSDWVQEEKRRLRQGMTGNYDS
jgi:hypothetical protein